MNHLKRRIENLEARAGRGEHLLVAILGFAPTEHAAELVPGRVWVRAFAHFGDPSPAERRASERMFLERARREQQALDRVPGDPLPCSASRALAESRTPSPCPALPGAPAADAAKEHAS